MLSSVVCVFAYVNTVYLVLCVYINKYDIDLRIKYKYNLKNHLLLKKSDKRYVDQSTDL